MKAISRILLFMVILAGIGSHSLALQVRPCLKRNPINRNRTSQLHPALPGAIYQNKVMGLLKDSSLFNNNHTHHSLRAEIYCLFQDNIKGPLRDQLSKEALGYLRHASSAAAWQQYKNMQEDIFNLATFRTMYYPEIFSLVHPDSIEHFMNDFRAHNRDQLISDQLRVYCAAALVRARQLEAQFCHGYLIGTAKKEARKHYEQFAHLDKHKNN